MQTARSTRTAASALSIGLALFGCAHTATIEQQQKDLAEQLADKALGEADVPAGWETAKSVDALAEDLAQELIETRRDDPKGLIAIVPPTDSSGRSTDFGIALANSLSHALFQRGAELVERQKIQHAYEELNLNIGAEFDENARVQWGAFVGARAILITEIRPNTDTVGVSLRLVETETGHYVGSAITTSTLDDNLRAMLTPRALSGKVILGELILRIAETKSIGEAWDDPAFGTADPYVLMKVGTQAIRWPVQQDTTTPTWKEEHLIAFQSGMPVEIYVVDADALSHDSIGTVTLEKGWKEEDLLAGRVNLAFGQVEEFQLKLVALPEK